MWLISSNSLKIRYAKGKELLKLTLSISRQTYIIFNTVFSRLEAHYIIEVPPIVRGSCQLPETFYRMKIGQFWREIWPFFWLNVTFQDLFTEINLARLIIVRFSIRNHCWKAENLLYRFPSPDPVLYSRRAPLNGRIQYAWWSSHRFLKTQLGLCHHTPCPGLSRSMSGTT